MTQRWTILRDDSGHRYLCPEDRADEAVQMLGEVDLFWMSTASERFGAEAPPSPDFLIRLEGGRLSFADPLVDGKAP